MVIIPQNTKGIKNLLYIALCFAGFIATLFTLSHLWGALYDFAVPFDTDEADHANAAFEIFWQFSNGTFQEFISAITKQGFYPPFHALVTALLYKLSGVSLQTSRLVSFFSLIGCIIVFSGAVLRSSSCKVFSISSLFILSVSGLLFTGSTIFIENSTLCMLELLSVLICCAILYIATYPINLNTTIFLSLLSIALFLTKYSFAIFILPALFVSLFIHQKKFAFVFTGIVAAMGIAWIAAIHFASFRHFLLGHPSYAPIFSWENILFDGQAWLFEYHSIPLLGAMTALLALLCVTQFKKSFAHSLSVCAVFFTFFVLFLSTTNESRHSIIVAPFIWFLALHFVTHPLSDTKTHNFLKIGLLVLLILGSYFQYPLVRKHVLAGMEGHPSYDQLISFLVKHIDPAVPTLVVGNNDQLSIETIQWYAAVNRNKPYSAMKFDVYPFQEYKVNNAILRGRNGDDWYTDSNIARDKESLAQGQYYKQIIMFRKIGSRDERAQTIKLLSDTPHKKNIGRKTLGQYEAIYVIF